MTNIRKNYGTMKAMKKKERYSNLVLGSVQARNRLQLTLLWHSESVWEEILVANQLTN